jgi:hypothetical protein
MIIHELVKILQEAWMYWRNMSAIRTWYFAVGPQVQNITAPRLSAQ